MKNKKKFFQLNPYFLPIQGDILIESSAGTGKTHTIILLYLRLLLGIKYKNTFVRPLVVQEILIVTFTKASSDELRERIQNSIFQMKIACINNGIGFKKTSIYKILLSFISNKPQAIKRLINAENQINENSIYTIHGFCKHILNEYPLQSNIFLKPTIIKDESKIQKKACFDFWRKNFYSLDLNISKAISDEWSNPNILLEEIRPYLQGKFPTFVNKNNQINSIKKCYETIINSIQKIKNFWHSKKENILKLIINSGINKRKYNKKNLSIWEKKISIWSKSKKISHKIPKELKYFAQKKLIEETKNKNIPRNKIFLLIETFLSKELHLLREFIILKSINEVRKNISIEKEKHGQIGFDDLLKKLNLALRGKNGKIFAKIISSRYPVTMIDEVQDTDLQQYKIFQKIYQNSVNCQYSLLLIGDPKQSIYSFRGADIFNYLKFRNKIKKCYQLNINWRSSPTMISSINKLFSCSNNPFIFKEISFQNVKFAKCNQYLKFVHKKKQIPGLNFYYLDYKNCINLNFKKEMADICANNIYELIQNGKKKKTFFLNKDIKTFLNPSDITILIRDHYEACIIQQSLKKFKIQSIFLSKKNNIFNTDEAQELVLILEAIITQEKSYIRRALFTNLIGMNIQQLKKFNENQNELEKHTKKFHDYLSIWKKYGILITLQFVIHNHKIDKNLLSKQINGKERLTNLINIGKLLKNKESELNNKNSLILWFQKKIKQTKISIKSCQINSIDEKENNLIKISTIHQSKGLQYPIVWIPFGLIKKTKNKKITNFHNSKFQKLIDVTNQENNVILEKKEQLAEELRLLYVSLTRSIYHCSIGIILDSHKKINNKNNLNSFFKKNVIGSLLENQKNNLHSLNDILKIFKNKDFEITPNSKEKKITLEHIENPKIELSSKKFTKKIKNNWKITSYSELISQNKYIEYNKVNIKSLNSYHFSNNFISESRIETKNNVLNKNKDTIIKTIHNFPRGKTAGKFLHSILELSSFTKIQNENWLIQKLKNVGLSQDWAIPIRTWIIDLFKIPLLNNGLSLSKIEPNNKLLEMEFCFSIKNTLHASDLEKISKKYDSLSKCSNSINFEPRTGIVKGCIDLFFLWKKKFYIIDYKSNWLGENSCSYNEKEMKNCIIKNRYDLQYQIYTLAVHRYLRNRIPQYNYEETFGGIIYLFLRGINKKNSTNGVYYITPSYKFIKDLDVLFN